MLLKRILFAIPLTTFTLYGKGLKDIENFFQAQGVIVGKVDSSTYICDKGLPYFRVGFPVSIYRGGYVENPLTHEKTFVIISQTGKGLVEKSFKTNSIIKLFKNNGVKIGDIARLDYQNICFKGSFEAFEKLQDTLPVVRKENLKGCLWAVKETPNGYEILFKGKDVFFTEKEMPSYAYGRFKISLSDLNIFVKPFELLSFKDIPVGVDAATVGNLNLVAVAFADRVDLYQKVGNGLTYLTSLPTPSGILVGIRLLAVGKNTYILGNAVTSDAEPVSFVAKMVGTNPVVVQKNIPYLFGVLRKGEKPLVVVQELKDGGFGKVYLADFEGDKVKVGKRLKVPEGFRADTAVYSSDGELVFIDVGGTLKIYKGDFKKGFEHFMDVEGDFGSSYTAVDIPSAVGDTSFRKLYFPPPPVEIQLFGFKGFLLAQNVKERIVPLLGEKILKFKEGRLVFVGKDQRGIYEAKTLRGFVFTDSVQGVAIDGKGTPYAVSGFKNPFLFQKGGKIYTLQFRYF